MTASPIWQVQLLGDQLDLEHLAVHLGSGPLRVLKDSQHGFLLASDGFVGANDNSVVLQKAQPEIAVLSGILKVALQAPRPLRAGAVHLKKPDGTKQIFVNFHDEAHARDILEAIVLDGQGLPIPQVPVVPRSIALLRLAQADPAVAKVLRLEAAADRRTWVGLYRLYEVMSDNVGGDEKLAKKGWGSKTDLRRFKHSSNSVAVAGDEARHGKELGDPPANPMTLDEGDAFCSYLIQAWLAEKGV